MIDRFATYAEISPSETGVKLFFTTASTDLPAVEALFDGKFGRVFKNGGGEHPPAIEVYRGRRYFVVTEESCGPTDDLREVSLADLEWLIRDAGPKFAGKGGGKPDDDSRSAKAFRAGAELKAAGATYEDMRAALLKHRDPEIVEWARTKGMDNGERELRRIYDRARTGAGVISLRAPYDTAQLFQRGLTTPLRHHRGSFFEWSGCAWPEAEEAMLRARLYAFLDQCREQNRQGRAHPGKTQRPDGRLGARRVTRRRATRRLDRAAGVAQRRRRTACARTRRLRQWAAASADPNAPAAHAGVLQPQCP